MRLKVIVKDKSQDVVDIRTGEGIDGICEVHTICYHNEFPQVVMIFEPGMVDIELAHTDTIDE